MNEAAANANKRNWAREMESASSLGIASSKLHQQFFHLKMKKHISLSTTV